MDDRAGTAEPRNCNGCSMCCFVLAVSEIAKPAGVWCSHCPSKRSCRIYDTRPQECRDFNCRWLTSPAIGDEWNPRRSRIVLAAELDGQRLVALVHPDRPNAWRREPYYSQLKQWSRAAVGHRGQILVKVAGRCFVILPDEDVALGLVGDDEVVVSTFTPTASGLEIRAQKLPRSDPRAAGVP